MEAGQIVEDPQDDGCDSPQYEKDPLPTAEPKPTFRVVEKSRPPPRTRPYPKRGRSPTSTKPLPFLRRRRQHDHDDDHLPYIPPSPQHRSDPQLANVVIVQLSGTDEKIQMAWKDVFRRARHTLYDCKYPFRIASEVIMRRNNSYVQPSRFARVPDDRFIQFLYDQASVYFGVEFEYDYFMDWLTNLCERPRHVVVFGLGQNPSAITMLDRLRQRGARVVFGPTPSGNLPGDYIARDVRDLERFVNRV